jgi:hypothetical protein
LNRNGEKGKEGRRKQGNLSVPFLFRLLRLRGFYYKGDVLVLTAYQQAVTTQ